MIEKATSNANIASMLQTLKAHQSQASGLGQNSAGAISTEKTDFSDMIRQAIGQTNAAQTDSQQTAQAFERCTVALMLIFWAGCRRSSHTRPLF